MKNINRQKLILYMLLFVPVISSVLSTIHIISRTSLGNPLAMAIATAITYEISSIVSFVSSGDSSASISKARLYFIFVLLFVLQCVGNTYSGFHYINGQLAADQGYLNDMMEMTFNILRPAELKLSLSALIGIPLPLISLIMLKSALEFADSIHKNKFVPECSDYSEELMNEPKEYESGEKNEEPDEPVNTEHEVHVPEFVQNPYEPATVDFNDLPVREEVKEDAKETVSDELAKDEQYVEPVYDWQQIVEQKKKKLAPKKSVSKPAINKRESRESADRDPSNKTIV